MNWSDAFDVFPSQFALGGRLQSDQMTSALAFAVLELFDHVIGATVHVTDSSGHVMHSFDHVTDTAIS